jgi:hypothetical protein
VDAQLLHAVQLVEVGRPGRRPPLLGRGREHRKRRGAGGGRLPLRLRLLLLLLLLLPLPLLLPLLLLLPLPLLLLLLPPPLVLLELEAAARQAEAPRKGRVAQQVGRAATVALPDGDEAVGARLLAVEQQGADGVRESDARARSAAAHVLRQPIGQLVLAGAAPRGGGGGGVPPPTPTPPTCGSRALLAGLP